MNVHIQITSLLEFPRRVLFCQICNDIPSQLKRLFSNNKLNNHELVGYQVLNPFKNVTSLLIMRDPKQITRMFYFKYSYPGRSRHKRATTGIRSYSTCPLHLVADYHFFEKAGRGSVSNAVSYMVCTAHPFLSFL